MPSRHAIPYDLERFVRAQDHPFDGRRSVFSAALDELRAGRKQSHWIWFVFPQLAGLGLSDMSRRYGIVSAGEAQAYLSHEITGARLIASTEAVLSVEGRSITDILGAVDAVKFRSSMTLFDVVATDRTIFDTALVRYFDGGRDAVTLDALRGTKKLERA